jgi:hypothetical protein
MFRVVFTWKYVSDYGYMANQFNHQDLEIHRSLGLAAGCQKTDRMRSLFYNIARFTWIDVDRLGFQTA